MEEGSLRVDANVSVRPAGSSELGTRAEIKNMNSLRSLGRAIEYEAHRQVELLQAGERVVQETRHWNEDDGRTHSMRSKEEAFDYRYFPEPDLVPLAPAAEWVARVGDNLPTLPAERRTLLAATVGLAPSADPVVTVVRQDLDGLVAAAVAAGGDPRVALNRAANEVAAIPQAGRLLDPEAFARLVAMEAEGKLTATQSKKVLAAMLDRGGDPEKIAADLGFEALADDALADAVDAAISSNPEQWQKFVGGNDNMANYLVGQVMQATKGKADAAAVTRLLRERRG
jgi:aspartyl-tRNA(Asn)/glutamyl-tRNA(Gln) amidotransferase subunit B